MSSNARALVVVALLAVLVAGLVALAGILVYRA